MKKISDTLDKNIQFILLSLAVGISVFSFLYYFEQNLITAYGDSRVHLNIARRVVNSLTPGIGQMIGSWLPLLHILMLPTIWVDQLWNSGISGSLVNMIAYITCCLYIYKLVVNITGKKINGICAFFIVALNINIIYFQATPMTEILFIATLIVSLYYIALWIDNNHTLELLKASFFMVLTSLNRYEGWFVVVGSIVLITIYSLIKHGRRKAEAIFFVYGTLAVSGIMFWLILHLILFGNPLEFLHNEFAAGIHTAKDIKNGLVPTYKNLYLASLTQVITMNHILGILLTIMFFPFIIYYSLRKKFNVADKLLLLFTIAFIPFLFEI